MQATQVLLTPEQQQQTRAANAAQMQAAQVRQQQQQQQQQGQQCTMRIDDCINLLVEGLVPNMDWKEQPKLKEGQANFTKMMYSKVLFHCKHCKEASFSKKPGKKDLFQCMTCEQQRKKDSGVRKFSAHNDMDPIPPEKGHIALPPALATFEEVNQKLWLVERWLFILVLNI
jgi:hypothetical protein